MSEHLKSEGPHCPCNGLLQISAQMYETDIATAERQRDEARALIMAYGAYLREVWPHDVERDPEEQVLLDYAAGLGEGK